MSCIDSTLLLCFSDDVDEGAVHCADVLEIVQDSSYRAVGYHQT